MYKRQYWNTINVNTSVHSQRVYTNDLKHFKEEKIGVQTC